MIKNIKKHIVISMTFTALLLAGCGDKRQEISSYGNQETVATATDAANEYDT